MEPFYKNRWLGIVMLVLLTANIVTLSLLWTNYQQLDSHKAAHPAGGGPAFEFVIRELNMNAAQQEQYRVLREEHQQQLRPLADSLARARNDYFGLLKDSTVAAEKLTEYGNRTTALQQQMELVNFRHFQKLRAICTPVQQQKFDSILQEVLKRFAGRRPGPPPGEGEEPPGPPAP